EAVRVPVAAIPGAGMEPRVPRLDCGIRAPGWERPTEPGATAAGAVVEAARTPAEPIPVDPSPPEPIAPVPIPVDPGSPLAPSAEPGVCGGTLLLTVAPGAGTGVVAPSKVPPQLRAAGFIALPSATVPNPPSEAPGCCDAVAPGRAEACADGE